MSHHEPGHRATNPAITDRPVKRSGRRFLGSRRHRRPHTRRSRATSARGTAPGPDPGTTVAARGGLRSPGWTATGARHPRTWARCRRPPRASRGPGMLAGRFGPQVGRWEFGVEIVERGGNPGLEGSGRCGAGARGQSSGSPGHRARVQRLLRVSLSHVRSAGPESGSQVPRLPRLVRSPVLRLSPWISGAVRMVPRAPRPNRSQAPLSLRLQQAPTLGSVSGCSVQC